MEMPWAAWQLVYFLIYGSLILPHHLFVFHIKLKCVLLSSGTKPNNRYVALILPVIIINIPITSHNPAAASQQYWHSWPESMGSSTRSWTQRPVAHEIQWHIKESFRKKYHPGLQQELEAIASARACSLRRSLGLKQTLKDECCFHEWQDRVHSLP